MCNTRQCNVVASSNDKMKRNIPFSNGRKGTAIFLESSGLQYSSISIFTASGNKIRNRNFTEKNVFVRRCLMFGRTRTQVNQFQSLCRRCLQNWSESKILRAYKEALSFVDALELFKRLGSCKSLQLDKCFSKKGRVLISDWSNKVKTNQ